MYNEKVTCHCQVHCKQSELYLTEKTKKEKEIKTLVEIKILATTVHRYLLFPEKFTYKITTALFLSWICCICMRVYIAVFRLLRLPAQRTHMCLLYTPKSKSKTIRNNKWSWWMSQETHNWINTDTALAQ